jgi:uncharacterized protein (DUF1501 family)
MTTRRHFLKTSSIVSLAPWFPGLLGNTARAAGAEQEARALVVIQLDGGNDGLNTIVPYADDAYSKARNKLRLNAKDLHKLDDHLALHSSMRACKELYDEGRLAIIQGVGYPNPNRSHFESMRIWHTGKVAKAERESYGWLGRALDQAGAADASRGEGATYVGEQTTPVALWGRRSSATALSRIDDLLLDGKCEPPKGASSVATVGDEASIDQFVTRELTTAITGAAAFRELAAAMERRSGAAYPESELSNRLRIVSQLLQSGSPARVYYTIQGGYDTHASQLYTHASLLREFSQALKAFLDDLKAAGLEKRVVVLAFSEFGRRVQENDSAGTDHGAAGIVFLGGAPINPGLYGERPDLSKLANGDLAVTTDFRRIYASILDVWLDVPHATILRGKFSRMPLFIRA